MFKKKTILIILFFIIIIFVLKRILSSSNDFDTTELYVTSTKNILVIVLRYIDKLITFILDIIIGLLYKLFSLIFGV